MLMLYFSPGACSMAAHIVLEESGEKYQTQQIHFANAEQRSEAYLKLNPQAECRHWFSTMASQARSAVDVQSQH